MPRTLSVRTPRTKEELINKILSYDFDGDIRHLGENTSVVRVAPHIVRLTFPDTGGVFDLTVHIPRDEHRITKAKTKVEGDLWEVNTTRRSGSSQ